MASSAEMFPFDFIMQMIGISKMKYKIKFWKRSVQLFMVTGDCVIIDIHVYAYQ